MYYNTYEIRNKNRELHALSDEDLIKRICSFLNQDLLNKTKTGNVRKYPVGIVAAEKQNCQTLNQNERERLIKAFLTLTTLGVKVSDVTIPDNVSMDKKVRCGITRDASGNVAVSVTAKDLKTVTIGYLDSDFANQYTIENQVVTGFYKNGNVTVVMDAEKLYAAQPEMRADGKYHYDIFFHVYNYGEKPTVIIKDMMQDFLMKEMAGGILERNGMSNPIVEVAGTVEKELFKVTIISDTALDGEQMLCLEYFLNYLTNGSAEWQRFYEWRRGDIDKHFLSAWMNKDTDFVEAVSDKFGQTPPQIYPVFSLKRGISEIKIIPSLDKDLAADSLSDEN